MMAPLRLSVLMILVAPFSLAICHGEQWTNQDGNTINASFVRMNLGRTVVVLRQEGKTYEVGLERLNGASQRQALRLQEEKQIWAQQELTKPLLTEEILLDLARFDRGVVAGRHCLVEGRVAKILAPVSVSHTQPRLLFELGTESKTDFSEYTKLPDFKLGITPEKVSLLRLERASGLRSYNAVQDLVSVGQLVVIRARVDDETIVGLGMAAVSEVKAARTSPRPQAFEAFLARRPQLPWAGLGPQIDSPHAQAAGGENAILEWISSLLGQSRQPAKAP